ncbi:MAG TPA: hypothetical protein GX513_01090 [Firmicutes bacterium]|nr:hypothetical protein [Bacillota bacterium]
MRIPSFVHQHWALLARVDEHAGERHKRFYTCTPQVFRGLGELYVADSRLTEFYERMRPGMAEFMRQGMAIYSDSLEKGQ